MSEPKDRERVRDPLDKGEDKSQRLNTSRNREESMKESGKDAFGGSAVPKPDPSSQGDGSSEPTDET